jgi:hypothetical protein
MCGQFDTTAVLTPCVLNRRLGGTQDRYGRLREETDLLHISRIEIRFLGRPLHSIITALPGLSFSIVMLCLAPPLMHALALTVMLPAAVSVTITAVYGLCTVLWSQGKLWRNWHDMAAPDSQRNYSAEAWSCLNLYWRLLALFGCVRTVICSVVNIRWSDKEGFWSDTKWNAPFHTQVAQIAGEVAEH